jgi:hypothetical protein
VVLNPGAAAKVELKVDRRGVEGPLQVTIAGAPAGVTATAVEIPAGQSVGQVDVAAAGTLGAELLAATLQITVAATAGQATQPLLVTVNKLTTPALSAPSDIVIQPGAIAAAPLTLARNGFEGPLEPKIEAAAGATITGKIAPIAAGQNETKLELTAAPSTPEGVQTVRVTASAGAFNLSLDVSVNVVKQPFSVDSFRVVTLKPGEEKKVDIPVQRTAFQGPIRMEITGLPKGVTAAAVDLAAGQPSASFSFTAAKDANSMVRTAKILSTAGYLTRSDNLIVRVLGTNEGFLPREVTDTEELFRLLRRGSFGGRMTSQSKQALMDAYGGTSESEDAVARGLKWLAKHQQSDGRWPLKNYHTDIFLCDCCTAFEADVVDMDTAGTALGVLPFLSAGITPERSPKDKPDFVKYKKNVEKALSWLVKKQAKNGDLGGTFYAHALGVMALCEAYALTADEQLKVACQLAVKYMLDGQHDRGGWRYGPKQEGDLSATGWIFLAIRTAQLAGVTIPRSHLDKAEKFIDDCASGPSEAKLSRYGYQKGTPATLPLTAAGLLTREYLGWKADNANLIAGRKYLMENLPPDSGDALGPIYYYYYATQVLHHLEGEEFDLWNLRMREHLLRSQAKSGHEEGSWRPDGADWGKQGGRIYATSLSLLTLQVYYRHLPLYRRVK